MATFYDIHQKTIERAFNLGTRRPGDCFRIIMSEPLRAPTSFPLVETDETATIITFRRVPEGRYEPAGAADRKAIAEWNERHKDTATDAWQVPDFGANQGR